MKKVLDDYKRIHEVNFLEGEIKSLGFPVSHEEKDKQKILNIDCPRCNITFKHNLINKEGEFFIDKEDLNNFKDEIKNH